MKKTLMTLGLCLSMYASNAWTARLGTVKDYSQEGNSVSFRCQLSQDWCYAIIDNKIFIYNNNCMVLPINEEPTYDPTTERYTVHIAE